MANMTEDQDRKDKILIKNYSEILEKFKSQVLIECTSEDGKTIDTKRYNKRVWDFEATLKARLEEARARQREKFHAERREQPKKVDEAPLTKEELKRLQISKDVAEHGLMHYKVEIINGKYMKRYPIYEINGEAPVYVPMSLSEIFDFKRHSKVAPWHEDKTGFLKNEKTKKTIACSLAGALIATSLLGGGAFVHSYHEDKARDLEEMSSLAESVIQVSELTDEEVGERLGNFMPEIYSYTNENGEFLRLDNMVDINYWAYKEVARELEEYQKQNPNTLYQADLDMLSGAIVCGIQMREASGGINCNKSNPDYQGPFSLPTDKEAMAEINFVAQKLSGEDIIDESNLKRDIQDPRLASKACLYSLIDNHRLLRDALDNAGLQNTEINIRMWLDSYLNGAKGVVELMTKYPDFYKDGRPYSARILEYADVFEDYSRALALNPAIREMDSSTPGRNAHSKLTQITDKYSKTDTEQRGNSGSEMN